ncbi:hypothetical protein SANTM175S_03064 [Streptomyces antimycoticus]
MPVRAHRTPSWPRPSEGEHLSDHRARRSGFRAGGFSGSARRARNRPAADTYRTHRRSARHRPRQGRGRRPARPSSRLGRGGAAWPGDRGGGRADRRGAGVLAAGRAAAGAHDHGGGGRAGRGLLLHLRPGGPPRGPAGRLHRGVRGRPRRTAGRAGGAGPGRRRRQALRLLRTAHPLQPLSAAPSDHPSGDRDPAALPAAGGLRARRGPLGAGAGRCGRAVPADQHAVVSAQLPHAVQLRHPASANVVLLSAGLTAGRAGLDLQPLPPGGAAVEARGRHRPVLLPYPGTRFADPGHQRALQWHRAVPAHARRLGGRRQPGRPAQGRGLRLSGDLARGPRGVPGAAGQHGRGSPPHPQPQHRPLDPGRVHAPGRGGRRLVAVLPGRRARSGGPVGR